MTSFLVQGISRGYCGLGSSSVQSFSHVRLFATAWTAECQASQSITNSQRLLKLNVHRVGDAIQPSHPLSSPSPPAFNLSQHQGFFFFSSESVLHIRWPKYWSFSFSISPFSENSRLISFRMDWFDLLAVQETVKSLQHHSTKASVLWCSDLWSSSHIHTCTTG